MRASQCLLVNRGSSPKATGHDRFRNEPRGYERNGAALPNARGSPNTARRARRGPLIFGGLVVYCTVCYGTYFYMSLGNTAKMSGTEVAEDVSDRYNHTAQSFDKEVDTTEKLMGLGWLRRSLTRQATGHVLEVSVGTGRNIRYYDPTKCSSITFVDQSAEMIEIARRKFRGMFDLLPEFQHLGAHEARKLNSSGIDTYPQYQRCRFLTQSSHDPIPRPVPNGFDTILQSMGICSTTNPSALLSHLGRLANPTTGRILLLEHGRSNYEWLNRILDEHAPAHADKHGCWWNRDIQKIVQDSGLEVVQIKRYHFGTTWWIELKPGLGRAKASE
ncbi:hypothetical protein MMC26_000986 [Xylographa opegraphella]|nr:hypothetical protein [Xylographa opegraphella]